MRKESIILVEGTSNTGKTSLCKYFEAEKGYAVVNESIRYLEERTRLKQGDIMSISSNINSELLNQELLFDMEFQKLFDANLFLRKGKNVIIDKSIFGIIATAYAFECEKNLEGAFANSIRLYHEFINKCKRFQLQMPDKLVLLHVEPQIFVKRNLNRSHVLSGEWTNPRIIEMQNDALNIFMRLPHIPLFVINTTQKTTKEIAIELEQHL